MFDGGAPTTLAFDITYRCNLRCTMCNSWKVADSRAELTTEQIIQVAQRFRDRLGIRKVRFVGGEPLVRDDLVEIIQAISPWSRTEIVTNGTAITDTLARQLVDSGLHQARFSIDGPEPVHDLMRGTGSFRRAVAGLTALRRARDRGGRRLPLLRVFACLSRLNAHHLEEMYAFARGMDADFQFTFLQDMTHVLPPEERLASRSHDPGGLRLPKTEQVRLQRQMARLKVSSSTTWMAAIRSTTFAAESAWERLVSRFYRDCDRSREYVLVDPWGDVVPCEYLPGYSYGSCVEEGPGVWFSERRRKTRAAIRRGVLPVCRECNRLGVHRYAPRVFRNLKRGLARLRGLESYDPG